MKKMILAGIATFGLVGAMATTASATCYEGCSYEMGSSWASGAEGGAMNIGNTVGDVGMVGSLTTKEFGAGGEATQYGANAWSYGQVNTVGVAAAGSVGWGPQTAGTSEEGVVYTAGGAGVTGYMGMGN